MEYQIVILPSAEGDIQRLAPAMRKAILRKLKWLQDNASVVIHHRLQNLPDDLSGLCRIRQSDYRVLYWLYQTEGIIKVYRIQHRSEVYRHLE